ncbi:hypothetical protein Hanom_Chr09g00837761 [Helianthus anomalus]
MITVIFICYASRKTTATATATAASTTSRTAGGRFRIAGQTLVLFHIINTDFQFRHWKVSLVVSLEQAFFS